MVQQLALCLPALRNSQSAPTSGCCVGVRNIGMRSPGCVCAFFQSDVFKLAGVKPEVAIAIPKRCGIADCGGNTFP
ncbi:non-specific lipid-transfer protein 4-like [Triticum aestivum]|uniref:Bifunctional inhibitor/plant lipid transfer protein/seed storage helical domain-containing protein n=1 Tax=Aegilops tauschii subsp. strangulata TaxID=200361 RepID=A0A453CT33_AEGTS|nr:non-specific lipid-transfer protein 4-like [Aegilops tauschii subsp. strangulata]XP_044328676.1 non-specific lipid-transfer protein 4-like [Triticum aestivum]